MKNVVAIAIDTTGLPPRNPGDFRPLVIAVGLAAVEVDVHGVEGWTGGFTLVRPLGAGTDAHGKDDGGRRASEVHLALAGARQALAINHLDARAILDEGVPPDEVWDFARAFTAGRRLVGFYADFLNCFLPDDLHVRAGDDAMPRAAAALHGPRRRRISLDNAFAALVPPAAVLPESGGRAHWRAIQTLAVHRALAPRPRPLRLQRAPSDRQYERREQTRALSDDDSSIPF